MLVRQEDFLIQLLAVKNILGSYYFYKAMHDEDNNNEYASDLYEYYASARQSFENSCNEHLPLIIGKSNTKMYNIETNEFVPIKFRRCLCCGKLLSPYEFSMKNEIDASNPKEDNTISDYNYFNKIYFESLDILIELVKFSKTREEALAKFKKIVEKQPHINQLKNNWFFFFYMV